MLQLQLLSKAVVADGVTAAEVLLLRHAVPFSGFCAHFWRARHTMLRRQ